MRSNYCGELNESFVDQEVELCGWVHRRRDHGGVIFLDVRDREGIAQVVYDPDIEDSFATAESVRNEFVIKVTGIVRLRPEGTVNNDMPTGKIEVLGKKLEVLNAANTPPIQLDEHTEVGEDIRFKEGDRSRFALHALTTDKLVLFATNGRFYTLGGDKVPRGRGHGEPVRLLTGLGNDDDIIELLVHVPGRKLIVASSDGRGFVVPEDQLIAQTKTGKQVLNVSGDREAQALAVIKEGDDNIACVGENRKLIIFALDELPEMSRGRGVVLQKYKDGNLSDIQSFKKADGLTWAAGVNRTRTENDLLAWEGKRAQAGRMAPKGFAVTNRFS